MKRRECMVFILLVTSLGVTKLTHAEDPPAWAQNAGKAQVVPLRTGAGSVFALQQSPGSPPRGVVLIVPDLGALPTGSSLASALSEGLADHRWTTLTLSWPDDTQSLDAALDHALDALRAGLAHLAGPGTEKIVVLGHGAGGVIATQLLSSAQAPAIQGLILVNVSLPSGQLNARYAPEMLETLKAPVLDVYGERDLRPAREAARRTAAARRGNQTPAVPANRPNSKTLSANARIPLSETVGRIRYRQMAFTGADRDFTGLRAALIKRIAGWLNKHIAGTTH